MDIHKIKKIIELIEKSSISKLEISEGKQTIRITRSISKISSDSSILPTTKTSEDLKYILKSQETNNTKHEPNEYILYSPMVGIFYRAANTNEEPFVSIGQSVKIGDTLCIIEAMKVMNQIQSNKSGIIKSILVDNGQPVEFGEPLLIIK